MSFVFDWQDQLEVGDVGETDFLRYYKKLAPKKSKDLTVDFWLKGGLSVELKTDTYDMAKTSNFFMELYGNEQKKLGGPWRAKQDCVNLFVYYFKHNKTFFWFDPLTLTEVVDKIIQSKKLSPVKIVNDGWAAEGYKIARTDVQCVCMRKDTF
jgi:hypothetical protein